MHLKTVKPYNFIRNVEDSVICNWVHNVGKDGFKISIA